MTVLPYEGVNFIIAYAKSKTLAEFQKNEANSGLTKEQLKEAYELMTKKPEAPKEKEI